MKDEFLEIEVSQYWVSKKEAVHSSVVAFASWVQIYIWQGPSLTAFSFHALGLYLPSVFGLHWAQSGQGWRVAVVLKSQKLLVGREVVKGYFFHSHRHEFSISPVHLNNPQAWPCWTGEELAGHGRGQEAPEEVWAMAPTLGTKTSKPLGVFGQLTHLEGGPQWNLSCAKWTPWQTQLPVVPRLRSGGRGSWQWRATKAEMTFWTFRWKPVKMKVHWWKLTSDMFFHCPVSNP